MAPRAGRSVGDLRARRRTGRWLKEIGVPSTLPVARAAIWPARPRIVLRPARPHFHHPAGRGDVLRILDLVGAEAIYGVRSIELSHAAAREASLVPLFGRLCIPGRILLYEQPLPPWRLPGILASGDADQLTTAGAIVTQHRDIGMTTIDWPGTSLRRFMLFDVLLHEIGHHILQHHKGKRSDRIARTCDHEAFAERFVESCRLSYGHLIDI